MRLDADAFREIVDTLTRNKSRSLLTGFGVFWGLFMLLFMLGGGQGVKDLIAKNFEGFASNTSLVISDRTTKPWKGLKEGRYWSLNYRDLDRLRLLVPELDVVTPMISVWGSTAVRDVQTSDISVQGVEPSYSQIEAPKLKYGRYINSVDLKLERKVCVIGKTVYKDLFPEGGDPCGEYIQVGPLYYQVVGVDYNMGSISINGTADTKVSIPISVAQKIYQRGQNVDIICVTGKPGVKMSSVEAPMRKVFAREHTFDPTDEAAVYILNTEELFSLVDGIFRGVDMLIWLIGLGTLLAGIIGVSNIMMVTVRERTTEIGIRRAIGATPRDVLSQVILESVLLTLISGFASIMFTVGALSLLETIVTEDATFQISFGLAVGAAALLAALGVAAGLAPAYRAMNIRPVDAMRDE